MKSYMMKTNLFLLPLRSYSLQFGSEALLAVASGVPILVSNSCGLAPLMEKLDAGKPVADDTFDDESDVDKMWKDRILELLLNPEEAQLRANSLREQLLLDTSIASTHLDLINTIVGKYNEKLRCDVTSSELID